MNKLDKDYCVLLQDIIDNGTKKQTRNGEVLSVFGRQIRHKMSDGFPLLTTKKMYWKGIVTELLWFLRGDTNIKYLVDNDCHIWDGDAYKSYVKSFFTGTLKENYVSGGYSFDDYYTSIIDNQNLLGWPQDGPISQEEFINKIKTDDEFAKTWGELGPIYGKQWRRWAKLEPNVGQSGVDKTYLFTNYNGLHTHYLTQIDQIQNLINDLKTNPDSRRLMVSAWNPGELDQMVLPPCHYGFQVYTRELSEKERMNTLIQNEQRLIYEEVQSFKNVRRKKIKDCLDERNVPTRAISLMWNQRSVDTFLGLPFNIASYGLLLEIIAKAVNMVPDELICNLGDTHLYLNHIEQAREQIGRKLTVEERMDWWFRNHKPNRDVCDDVDTYSPYGKGVYFDSIGVPKTTRDPYPLPILNIGTEWWPTESGECGVGPLDAVVVFNSFKDDNFCKCFLEEDVQLEKYQSHPAIKAPLSN